MTYDPFARGSAPVGVRTLELRDGSRGGRRITVEIWYPASADHQGQDCFAIAPGLPEITQQAGRDAEPLPGRFPLVVYCHGANSDRRGASSLTTHLASHGYVVAAPDFAGDTAAELVHDFAADSPAEWKRSPGDRLIANRPADAAFVIESLTGASRAPLVDPEQVGTCGHSFGGWTSIALNSRDPRPKASFVMAPAWGKGPLPTEMISAAARLDDWGRPVETFVLAGERDACVLLSSLRGLYRDLSSPKRFAVLRNAGHCHFVDSAEESHELLRSMWSSGKFPDPPGIDYASLAEASGPFSDLCPAAHGIDAMRALCLAHMDAELMDSADARAFLDGDLAGTFAARGIGLDEVARQTNSNHFGGVK